MNSTELIDSPSSEGVVPEGVLDGRQYTWDQEREKGDVAPVEPFSTRSAWLSIVGFGLLTASVIWAVQYMTTEVTLWKDQTMIYKDWVYRFLLDFGLATACFAMLSSRVVAVLAALHLWIATAVISYHVNYQRSLSWVTITNQSGEGAAVAMVALEDAAPYLAFLIPAAILIVFAFRRLRPRIGRHPRVALVGVGVWLVVFLGMVIGHKPLNRLAKFETADGAAHAYGYVVTWIAEGFYVDYEGISEDAIARLRKPVNRLLKAVPPVEIGTRLAVVQVESLDDAVRGFEIGGRQVTPRLNDWAKKGTYLRVQSPKVNGSCDADFTLLYGALPSERMAPYRIPHFPFNRSLANALHDRGYATSFFHGVNGNFFERRAAYGEMNFDRLVFREELIHALDIKEPEWTLEDGKMFRFATRERRNVDRFFEFSITGTSHTPFRFSLEDFDRTFFPDPDDREHTYFDTVAYVDHVIGEYVDGLPVGTVVVIYGDHWSRVHDEELGYASQMVDEFGIVPAVLFRKTEGGVEPLFSVDKQLAMSAKLRLGDVTAWLRQSLHVAPAYEASGTRGGKAIAAHDARKISPHAHAGLN